MTGTCFVFDRVFPAVLPIRPQVWYGSVQRQAITEVAIVSVVLEHLQRSPPVIWTEVLTPVSKQR